MKIGDLTAKDLRVKLKNNWTREDFLKHYECTQEELKLRLLQLYQKDRRKVNDVFKEMRRNEKVAKKSEEVAAAVESMPATDEMHRVWLPRRVESILDDIIDTSESSTIDDVEAVEMTDENVGKEICPPTFEEKLSTLKSREEELSQGTIALEKEWYDQKSRRTECLKSLRKLEVKMEAMRDELAALYDNYKCVVEESNECAEKMNATIWILREMRTDLNDVRDEIRAMSKITIGVTLEGEIVTFDENGPRFDDAGHEEIYRQILEEEICSELRLKEIRAVARLLAIAQHATTTVEVICDNPDVEAVFNLLAVPA